MMSLVRVRPKGVGASVALSLAAVTMTGLMATGVGHVPAQVHEGVWPCSGQFSRGYLETSTAGATYLRAPGGEKTSYWSTGGTHSQAATSLYNLPLLGGGSWDASAPTIYDSEPGCTLA